MKEVLGSLSANRGADDRARPADARTASADRFKLGRTNLFLGLHDGVYELQTGRNTDKKIRLGIVRYLADLRRRRNNIPDTFLHQAQERMPRLRKECLCSSL